MYIYTLIWIYIEKLFDTKNNYENEWIPTIQWLKICDLEKNTKICICKSSPI